MPKLDTIIQTSRVIICVGPGGVGKTTTAAAIALRAARFGRKVLVLTVDPARRLANSLGMSEMMVEPTKVNLETFGIDCGERGALWAMMLDIKTTFDRLISRHAPDEETRYKITSNPYYRQLSTALAGSQEYMAMEKLYELREENNYDLIVLDTPPTHQALDFLDAPDRMEGFFDNTSFKLILQSSRALGRIGIGFLKMNTLILKGVSRFVGADTFLGILEFLQSFSGMTAGFTDRARRVRTMMGQADVSFVLLSGPERASIDEGLYFYRRLKERNMPFGAFVVNRIRTPFVSETADPRLLAASMWAVPAVRLYSRPLVERVADKLVRAIDDYSKLVQGDAKQLSYILSQLPDSDSVYPVPYFDRDIHDITGLFRFQRHLLESDKLSVLLKV
ncbi:MAG: ArsA family ATPase [Myxococcales bacterium]|nr:ArsA family ATPase [Myxococcales bacterium]